LGEHEEDTQVAKKGHTEEQILRALRQVECGTGVADIYREHRISDAMFYIWKKKHSGLGLSELRELGQLRCHPSAIFESDVPRQRSRGLNWRRFHQCLGASASRTGLPVIQLQLRRDPARHMQEQMVCETCQERFIRRPKLGKSFLRILFVRQPQPRSDQFSFHLIKFT